MRKKKNKSLIGFLLLFFIQETLAANNNKENPEFLVEKNKTSNYQKKRIGILTLPIREHFGEILETKISRETELDTDFLTLYKESSYYPESYPEWLNGDQVEHVPLEFYSLNKENIPNIMMNLDGLLLTGGGTQLYQIQYEEANFQQIDLLKKAIFQSFSSYTKKVKNLIDQAIQINRKEKRTFPVWGTCLGFESLLLAFMNTQLQFHKVKNFKHNAQIQIIPRDQEKENIFQIFNQQQIKKIQKDQFHFFNHKNAVLYDSVKNNDFFNSQFEVLAISRPKNEDIDIVAAIQHKELPFFAVQFHPEKLGYEKYSGALQDEDLKKLMQKYSDFFLKHVQSRNYNKEYDILNEIKRQKINLTDIGNYEKVSIFVPKYLLEQQFIKIQFNKMLF